MPVFEAVELNRWFRFAPGRRGEPGRRSSMAFIGDGHRGHRGSLEDTENHHAVGSSPSDDHFRRACCEGTELAPTEVLCDLMVSQCSLWGPVVCNRPTVHPSYRLTVLPPYRLTVLPCVIYLTGKTCSGL